MSLVSPKPSSSQKAIVVVALGFLALALAYSARAVLGMAMPIWEDQNGWSIASVSNIAALTLLIMAVVAPLSGILLDKKGLRFTLLVGLTAVCASCLLVSVSTNIWLLLLGFGIIGGVGFGIIATHIVAAAVARVYPRNVGLASGIATSGSTAGQFLIVPIIAVLLETYNWQIGFVTIAIGAALLIPLIWIIPSDKPEHNKKQSNEAVKDDSNWRSESAIIIKSPVFHLLFWSYLICGYTTSGVIETHLLPYASFCGFGALPSATAYGLLSAINLLGMIGVGWLTDKMNRPLLLGIIYIIRGFTFWILLNVGTSYETLLAFAVIFGAVDYSTVPVTTSLVASHLGLRVVGFVMGLLTAGHQIGAAIGASLGGYFYATNSSYDLIWMSSLVLAIIAGLLCFILKENPGESQLKPA